MASNFKGRGGQAPRISRRRFFQGLIGGSGALIAGQLLAACGDGSAADTPTSVPAGATSAPAANAPAATGAATTLTLMMDEGEFSDDQIKAFTDANPNIKVQRLS